MYLEYDGLNNETETVMTLKDVGKTDVLQFGEVSAGHTQSMLFRDERNPERGQVMVIAVPFRKGSHICKTIDQAIDMVKWLQNMHDKGYVHGDIRAFNLVFSRTRSVPIDFDFGGQEGEVRFPRGYQTLLDDGNRTGCEAGNLIARKHDCKALNHVLTSLHEFDYGEDWKMQNPELFKECAVAQLDVGESETMEQLHSALEALKGLYPKLKMKPSEDYAFILDEKAPKQFPKVQKGPRPSSTAGAAQVTAFGTQESPDKENVVNPYETQQTGVV